MIIQQKRRKMNKSNIKHIKVTEFEYKHDNDLGTRTLTIDGKVFALVGALYGTVAMKVGLDDLLEPREQLFGAEEPELSEIEHYDLYFAMDKNGKKITDPEKLASDGEWVAEIRENGHSRLTVNDLEEAMMDGAKHYLQNHYGKDGEKQDSIPEYEDKDLANHLTDTVCELLFGDTTPNKVRKAIYNRVLNRIEELGDGDK